MRPNEAAARLRQIAEGLGNPPELLSLADDLEAVRPGLGDAITQEAPAAGPGNLAQTYVSAPAAGAIALVMGLAGVGGGYLLHGQLNKGKGKKRLKASEDEE